MESDSSDSSSSDSDEVLEEVTFLQSDLRPRSHPCTPVKIDVTHQKKDLPSIGRKLDMLLTSHKEEETYSCDDDDTRSTSEGVWRECSEDLDMILKDETHQMIKEKLLYSIEQGSQVEASVTLDESLNGELAGHIEQLEVAVPKPISDHPTLTVFAPNKFCCLFKETICPFSCGFSRSHFSKIDKVLATYKPHNLLPLLISNTLPSCFHQVSSPHCVVLWLLSLLSIHSSSVVVEKCCQNLARIIQNYNHRNHKERNNSSTEQTWRPKPMEIVRILVNMGANPVYLLGDQSLYTADDTKEYLSVDNDENDAMPTRSPGRVKLENCRRLLETLTRCFLMKPEYGKDEISLMVCVIARLAMDSAFQNLELQHTFQALLSSLLECYKDSDWLSVVPCLCRDLSTTPHHHHCAVYLSSLIPVSERGNQLQTRLSFLLLCSTLQPDRKDEICHLELDSISPSMIAQLGLQPPPTHPQMSHLYSCLHGLIKEDGPRMNSALSLLDSTVGDETHRTAQPKDELHFLTNQVKMAIKDIRDNINTLDLSRIKDKMTVMTVKWMMMSAQNNKSVQRSIFSWVTSHSSVPEEKLKDSAPDSAGGDEEKMDL